MYIYDPECRPEATCFDTDRLYNYFCVMKNFQTSTTLTLVPSLKPPRLFRIYKRVLRVFRTRAPNFAAGKFRAIFPVRRRISNVICRRGNPPRFESQIYNVSFLGGSWPATSDEKVALPPRRRRHNFTCSSRAVRLRRCGFKGFIYFYYLSPRCLCLYT